MPQFDFYTWSALSFWTIFFFQIFYLFFLYFILSSVSDFQKTLQKLMSYLTKEKKNLVISDFFCNLFLNQKVLK